MSKKFVPVFSDNKISYVSYMEEYRKEAEEAIAKLTINNVRGFISPHDFFALFCHAKRSKTTILEIGTLFGLSACIMALANPDVEIFSIDIYDESLVEYPKATYTSHFSIDKSYLDSTSDNFPAQKISEIRQNNVDKLGIKNVKFVKGASYDVCNSMPNDNDLLFIDGDHNENGVLLDLLLYVPKMASGATILLHDTNVEFPGVERAIRIYLKEYNDGKLEDKINKVNPNSSMSMLRVK